MVEPLRHRQTKGAETDMLDLTPPRHVSTLPTPAGRFAQIEAIDRASLNFLSTLWRSVPEHINAVIDEVGLDKWGFTDKLSSEWRKQSERNEGDDGRQSGLRTTE